MPDTKNRIRDIIAECMEVDSSKISFDENLFTNLGIDSLDAIEISMNIEEEFDISIPDEKLAEFESITIMDIVKFIDECN